MEPDEADATTTAIIPVTAFEMDRLADQIQGLILVTLHNATVTLGAEVVKMKGSDLISAQDSLFQQVASMAPRRK